MTTSRTTVTIPDITQFGLNLAAAACTWNVNSHDHGDVDAGAARAATEAAHTAVTVFFLEYSGPGLPVNGAYRLSPMRSLQFAP